MCANATLAVDSAKPKRDIILIKMEAPMRTGRKMSTYDRWMATLASNEHANREELLAECRKLADAGGMFGVIAAVVLAREASKANPDLPANPGS